MITVLVTEPEYLKAVAVFSTASGFTCLPAPADERGLSAKVRETGARYVIVGVVTYTRELYEALPSGGVIARFGVGHDGVDKAQAKSRGILCCNTPGVLDDSVAECALGLMLAVARSIAVCSAGLAGGTWSPRVGVELSGKTLAIIGCGKIGRKVAAAATYGFGMRVVGLDQGAPAEMGPIAAFSGDFATAVASADFVSIHIPDTASNRNYINRERLALMRPSSFLINTARGGVVDEDAVYDAVKSGHLAGAGLDVFKKEPYVPSNPEKDLRTLAGVVMTPHIGSSTQEACTRMARAALQNLERAAQGRIQEMSLVG